MFKSGVGMFSRLRIKGGVLRGTAANAKAAQPAEAFPRLARLAREATEKCV